MANKLKSRRRQPPETFPCPNCGADVIVGKSFCRECGASYDSGWAEDDYADDAITSMEGADDEFDYDEFVRREFPSQASPDSKKQIQRGLVAIILLAVCLALLISSILGF